ncbi:5-formyltetrahydrofolate cyclo-ligase [Endozoicomonas sp. (ex Bugula neritina AB1)]|nr:5-formyltetrahydrofolate cyclo-ligase [Endozoicomonas sp. (ex Bugula neritina AB1)]
MESDRTKLRQRLRARRQALNSEEQKQASEALLDIIRSENIIENCQHVAVYLANDGEINPNLLVKWLWQQGVKCYLPVLDIQRKKQLLFAAYDSKTVMVSNRFRISEPVVGQSEVIDPQDLDLVFMPLTGFSADGQRLGMGGGFYDRTFAFTQASAKPQLIGLAHECQKVADTYSSNWDVPMYGVVTDQQFYCSGSVF